MKKPCCVFILGNGFSQGVGFPNSKQLWKDCLVASNKTHLKGYFDSCLEKYPVSYFKDNGIDDIELLLSVWSSYIENYNQMFPDCSKGQSTQGLYESYIENLCGHLLEYGDGATSNINYNGFKIWLNDKMSTFEFRFVTLNYDLVLERLITEIDRKIIYLGDSIDVNSVFLRKLHGSANWLKSNLNSLIREDGWKPEIIWKDEEGYVHNINDNFSTVPYVAFAMPPVLIPPILNKEYTKIFKELLKFAFNDLKEAKFVIIVGYSLPDSDLLIRQFLEDYSKQGASQCSKLVYINPDLRRCNEAKRLLGYKLEVINSLWSTKIFDKILGESLPQRILNSGNTKPNFPEKR